MCKKAVFLSLLLSICSYGFAQQPRPTEHRVQKGETLYSISRKYGLTPYDLLRENPDLDVDDLAIGTRIRIPLGRSRQQEAPPQQDTAFFYHTVEKGETLASLKRRYGVSLEALKRWNPDWPKGLAIGQRVKVPRSAMRAPRTAARLPEGAVPEAPPPAAETRGDSAFYTVKPHETLYALHQRFKVSIQALKDWNGGLPEGLKAGMSLRIKAPKIALRDSEGGPQPRSEPALNPVQADAQRDTLTFVNYTVQEGQTLFGVLHQTETSFEALLHYNPALRGGLTAGMRLRIPRSVAPEAPEALDFDRMALDFGAKAPLRDSIGDHTQLNVVLLAPFYTLQPPDTTSVSGDAIVPDTPAAPKSRFATAFAIGAQLALDSLQRKGLDINFSLFDTGRDARDLRDLLATQPLKGVDLIIGPFYSDLSEQAAQWLDSIPVVSPFSQRLNLYAHPNLIQVRAPEAFMEEKVLKQLLRESQAADEILVLCTPSSHCERVTNYLKERSLAPLEVMPELPDDSTLYDLKDRSIQVVFPDKTNPNYAENLYKLAEINTDSHIRVYFTHDVNYYSAMPVRDVIKLKLTLPKATYHSRDSEAYQGLEKKFTARYKMGPRVYELMGYDITYDFLMRLSQHPDLYPSLQTRRSTDVQLVTDFKRLKGGGYFNGGFFLLRYGRDGLKPLREPREKEGINPVERLP